MTQDAGLPDDVARDDEGFLLEVDDWSVELAERFARDEGLVLDARHWQVIDFIRSYHDESQTVPEARRILKHLRNVVGEAAGTRKYLYALFPGGYGQTACKIAGMRKPLKLMLDV